MVRWPWAWMGVVSVAWTTRFPFATFTWPVDCGPNGVVTYDIHGSIPKPVSHTSTWVAAAVTAAKLFAASAPSL
jgi:hypothetical protein